MFKSIAIRLFGMRKAGWANVYLRHDGTMMTGGMLYNTRNEAIKKGRCYAAESEYVGTLKFYY